jgi:hypothetical protein
MPCAHHEKISFLKAASTVLVRLVVFRFADFYRMHGIDFVIRNKHYPHAPTGVSYTKPAEFSE